MTNSASENSKNDLREDYSEDEKTEEFRNTIEMERFIHTNNITSVKTTNKSSPTKITEFEVDASLKDKLAYFKQMAEHEKLRRKEEVEGFKYIEREKLRPVEMQILELMKKQDEFDDERNEEEKYFEYVDEQEELERQRLEEEKLLNEQLEKQRLEEERLLNEQLEKQRLEEERLLNEQLEKQRLEEERLLNEQLEKQRLEEERKLNEELERQRLEEERLLNEQLEKQRLEEEQKLNEELERQRLENERLLNEQLEEEQRLQEELERQRLEEELKNQHVEDTNIGLNDEKDIVGSESNTTQGYDDFIAFNLKKYDCLLVTDMCSSVKGNRFIKTNKIRSKSSSLRRLFSICCGKEAFEDIDIEIAIVQTKKNMLEEVEIKTSNIKVTVNV